MLQTDNLKLALVQLIKKSTLFTLYSLVRGWTTKSKFHLTITPILKISTRRKREILEESTKKNDKVIVDTKGKPFVPKAPFPQCLQVNRKKNYCKRILEVFKNVQINILFLDEINQIPSYAKFLKGLTTVKRKIFVPREAIFVAQESYLMRQTIAPKYKDLGSSTSSVKIRDKTMDRCMLNLGVNVNFLSYSVYKQLGLRELQPTNLTWLLVDRSVKIPKGIVEDVILKVDKFYIPTDFVVLDTVPVMNPISHSPVILGRPFLTTTDAVIRFRNGVMTLSFGNMTVELNVFHTNSQPPATNDHEEVNMIVISVSHTFEGYCYGDLLKKCLAHFG